MCRQIALHVDRNHQRQSHIRRNLQPLGFELHKTAAIAAARDLAHKHRYHLVLVHYDTAAGEIFSFCSFMRSGNAHVILIALMSEPKIQIEEKLFDCGASDVVAGSQTSAGVLAKRIRAHLHYTRSPWPQTGKVRLKDTIVDFDKREVWCSGTIRRLPGILSDLLKYFLDNPNRIISRAELRESPIWADSICSDAARGGKTFDVNVGKLRKIIEPDPTRPQIIESVRGAGWKLAVDSIGSNSMAESQSNQPLPLTSE